jgi:hypothetical protein
MQDPCICYTQYDETCLFVDYQGKIQMMGHCFCTSEKQICYLCGTDSVSNFPFITVNSFRFSCSVCGRPFHDFQGLIQHMFATHYIVFQNKTSSCGLCGHLFHTFPELTQHMFSSHYILKGEALSVEFQSASDTPMPSTLDTLTQEISQITTFENEGPVQHDDLADMLPPPRSFPAGAQETRDHSIKDILSREYYLGTVTWHRTDEPGAELYSLQFPQRLIEGVPTIREKLNGFTYLRSDVRLRVEINSQPFQQGRLIGVFFPGLSDRAFIRNLTHLTGYHSNEVDIQTSQELALTIPFVAPVSHVNLCKNWGTVGSIAIFVYGQLAGGTTDVEIAIWASLVNPDPQVPTAAPLYNPSPMNVKSQGLGKERAAAAGPITRVARTVAGVSKVASLIPGISAAAGVVNTVSSFAADLASTFGWSKPIQEMPSQVMQQNPARYFNNFNGVDNSKVLALDQENAVEQYSGLFGSGVDEMSIQYITQTPNFFRSVPWRTVNEAGQYLTTIPIHPGYYGVPDVEGTQIYWNPTHLSYVTSVFKRWRGDLLFRFKLVKTKFHSGRIRVSYVPQLDTNYGTFPELDLNRAYSMVVDIRNRSEFDFEVPFVYPQPWADCSDISNVRTNDSEFHLGMTGFLVVDVINKLVAPTGLVSPTVDILIEVCAGKNFELSVPKECYWTPVNKVQPALPAPIVVENITSFDEEVVLKNNPEHQVEEEIILEDELHQEEPTEVVVQQEILGVFQSFTTKVNSVLYQSYFLPTRSETQISDSHSQLFETQTDLSSSDAAALTIGEKIVSLRQLFQRFQKVFESPLPSVAPNVILIQPYAVREVDHFVLTKNNDYFSYFMPLFAFMRGGMRIKLLANYDTRMINKVNTWLFSDQTVTAETLVVQQTTPSPVVDSCLPNCVHFPGLEGIVEVSVPYYNSYPVTYNPFYMLPALVSAYPDPDAWMHANLSYVAIDNVPASTTGPFSVYRAIGEDFSAGFLVGAPLCVDPLLSVP